MLLGRVSRGGLGRAVGDVALGAGRDRDSRTQRIRGGGIPSSHLERRRTMDDLIEGLCDGRLEGASLGRIVVGHRRKEGA